MPALPWMAISRPDSGRDYLVMASRLPLARYRDIARLPARHDGDPDPAGRRQRADRLFAGCAPGGKTFWTLSAWESQNALDAFSRADPHRSRVSAIRPRMRPTTFRFWTVRGADLPVSWDEARRRIAARGNQSPITSDPDRTPMNSPS